MTWPMIARERSRCSPAQRQGPEFPVVFMVGMEEGGPAPCLDDQRELEEERHFVMWGLPALRNACI